MLVRKDDLTSQKIETALVFHMMLGWQDAHDYLQSEKVPLEIIERVLFDGERRTSPATNLSYDPAPSSSFPSRADQVFYVSSGRRKDVVRMAVVQAALTLRAQLGDLRIEQLLRREKLSDEVIARVLQGEARTMRARPHIPQAE